MSPVSFTVKKKGKLFTRGHRELDTAFNQTMTQAAEAGEERLNKVLSRRPTGVYLNVPMSKGGSGGNYRRNIQKKLVSNRHALLTDGGVIYGPWLETGGGRFPGYASFRKTKDYLQKQITGIANNVVKKMAGRLNS